MGCGRTACAAAATLALAGLAGRAAFAVMLRTTLALVIAVVAAGSAATAATTLRAGRTAQVGRCFAAGDRNVDAHQALDIAQQAAFVRTAESDRDAVTAGTGGTADAVDVGVRHFRQVVVEDVAEAGMPMPRAATSGDSGGSRRRGSP